MTTAVVCGFSPVGTVALKELLTTGVEVLALYTYEPKADEQWYEPPEVIARQHNIPVYKEPNFNTDEVYARIAAQKPDFLFSFYFREMIQERFLKIPPLGAYNLHGSLLPKYRGRAPINWVLVYGETETALTLHAMTPKPDDGDIIGQIKIPLAWDATALSLMWDVAVASGKVVQEMVPKLIDGTALRIKQSTLGPSTYFGGRKPQDGELIFTWPVQRAFNMVRAVADPWPNAFIKGEQGEVQISWALPSASSCPQGHFQLTKEGVLLGFADGALRIHALRYNGVRSERPTEHAEWLRQIGIPEKV